MLALLALSRTVQVMGWAVTTLATSSVAVQSSWAAGCVQHSHEML